MPIRPSPPSRDLREACVAEAMAIIDALGVEQLSLREVARRLRVSHQAPYRHFASRDHLVAEVVARAFADFGQALDAEPKTADPDHDMATMGRAYLDYARRHPLQYRLMFGTPLPDAGAHPDMMRQARHAFSLLCDALRRKRAQQQRDVADGEIVQDAMFIWAGLHGLATIVASSAVATLGIDDQLLAASHERLLRGFGQALDAR